MKPKWLIVQREEATLFFRWVTRNDVLFPPYILGSFPTIQHLCIAIRFSLFLERILFRPMSVLSSLLSPIGTTNNAVKIIRHDLPPRASANYW
jgi:hypothetical protein